MRLILETWRYMFLSLPCEVNPIIMHKVCLRGFCLEFIIDINSIIFWNGELSNFLMLICYNSYIIVYFIISDKVLKSVKMQ